ENNDPDRVGPQAPKILPTVPEFLASYGLTFDHPGINLMANLNATYIGDSWVNDYTATPDPNGYTLFGGYTVVDFALEKRLWDFGDKGNLGLRAEVNNIFDSDYAFNLDYPLPGRNFYVGLRYTY
ncbi:MAG: TonB-dependent receptor, partial [Deltaproteobacteria bacterium]|nr:TonB-dependent receptor [Deltaproteobacteria bacterium]